MRALLILVAVLVSTARAYAHCSVIPNQDIRSVMRIGETAEVTVRIDTFAGNGWGFDIGHLRAAMSCATFFDCIFNQANQARNVAYAGDAHLHDLSCGVHWKSTDPFGGATGLVEFVPDAETDIPPGGVCEFVYGIRFLGFLPPPARFDVLTNEIEVFGACEDGTETSGAGESQDAPILDALPAGPCPVRALRRRAR